LRARHSRLACVDAADTASSNTHAIELIPIRVDVDASSQIYCFDNA
jgi:hypothetical protein